MAALPKNCFDLISFSFSCYKKNLCRGMAWLPLKTPVHVFQRIGLAAIPKTYCNFNYSDFA
jgi:hypothetical protein